MLVFVNDSCVTGVVVVDLGSLFVVDEFFTFKEGKNAIAAFEKTQNVSYCLGTRTVENACFKKKKS